MKKTTSILAILLMTTCISTISCTSHSKAKQQETPIPVEVYKPFSLNTPVISVSGILTAKNSAQLSTRMVAFVDEVYVKRGDKVKTGQLLIRLNSNDLLAKKEQVMAQLSAAKLASENANKDYQRFKNLHAKESVSDKEFENMKLNKTLMDANLKSAQQGLEEIEAMLAYTLIKSPFSGTVTQKYIDKGSTATPGTPLLTVEQSHEMQVTASIPERYIPYVNLGNKVDVEIKTLHRNITGKISELSSSASLSGGQYAMKVQLDEPTDPSLLAGMYVTVNIFQEEGQYETNHLFIEKTSLIHREQLNGVFVVNANGQAVMRWLQLGKSKDNLIEVLSGLNNEELIVRNVDGNLYNGRKVSVNQ